MATHGRFLLCILGLALGAGGCGGGGGSADDEELAEQEQSSGDEVEQAADEDESVAIEGLMGTISADAVDMAMQSRMSRFGGCFEQRWDDLDVLGGRILMAFRIRTDGSVLWVYPKESSVGDRETERCILDIAARIRFRRPRGGEAEFEYPLELDTPSGRAPSRHLGPLAGLDGALGERLHRAR